MVGPELARARLEAFPAIDYLTHLSAKGADT